MRKASTYRAARRNEARRRGLDWRKLLREKVLNVIWVRLPAEKEKV